MSIDTRDYADCTSVTQSYPIGTYRAARVMCSDGRVRAVKRIAATADTFFSVPCAVTVTGRTVSGYLTVEARSGSSVTTDDDPAVVKFIAYDYGRNADRLPTGPWRSDRPATPTVAACASYYQDGHLMFDDWYGEAEADGAAAFTVDGTCVVSLTRAPRGRWAIDTSDYGHTLPVTAYLRRFDTVADAVDYLSARVGVRFRLVDDWDDADAVA
jgi:hypothetical protein